MSFRASVPATLLFAAIVVLALPAASRAATPIQLADPASFGFRGASLVVADFDGNARPDLAGAESTKVVLAINTGTGAFTSRTLSMASATLIALAAVDLDGDGRVDLAAVTSDHDLLVRRNGPSLVFAATQSTPLPSRAYGLALGDLNGDGWPDAATTLPDNGQVAVLFNDGTGHLGAPTTFAVGSTFTAPLIADFTGDGRADLVVAVYEPTFALLLLRGKPDGSLGAPEVALQTTQYRYSLRAADLDLDGDLDIAAVGDEQAIVYSNLGGGVFAEGTPLVAGYQEFFYPSAGRIDVGDFDRDGWPDLAIAARAGGAFGEGNSYLAIFRNSNGVLAGPALQYRVGVHPRDVALADLDGDGWLDGLATCESLVESGWGTSSENGVIAGAFVLHNFGDSGLNSLLEVYEPVWLPVRPATGALPDLYGEHGGRMYRARNRGHGLFAGAENVGHGEPVAARDLDGDGDEDLLVVSADSLWVQLQLGVTGLGEPHALLVGAAFLGFADAGRDGRLDLFVSDAAHRVRVLRGDGAGNFGPAEDTGIDVPLENEVPQPGAARDVDGDGYADVLFADWKPCQYDAENDPTQVVQLIRWRGGPAGFASPDTARATLTADFKASGGGGPLRFGDWNGDSHLDVACAPSSCLSGNATWFPAFFGHGDDPFVALPTLGGGSMCDLAAADLNGDHLDDLVQINSPVGFSYMATLMASEGTGAFTYSAYQMGDLPARLALADLDGDGRLDVITKNLKGSDYTRFTYSIRLNRTPAPEPTAVLMSLLAARFVDGAVHLDWAGPRAGPFTGSIERRTPVTAWGPLASVAGDATGHVLYVDRAVAAGESYAYRLQPSGATAAEAGSAWIAIPGAAFALRGAVPNPAIGRPSLQFTLPAFGDVEMRLVDVAGRVVRRERIAGLDPGAHRIGFAGPALAPGYYMAVLEHGGRRLQAAVMIIR